MMKCTAKSAIKNFLIFFAKFLDMLNCIWFVFYWLPFLWHYQLHLAYAKHEFELGEIMLDYI